MSTQKLILFVDDEELRTRRYRERLEILGEVRHLSSADEALRTFKDPQVMQRASLVVLDLGMYTGEGMSERDTGFGRLTGEVLRRNLRAQQWTGPVIVLSNSPDERIREQVENDGDVFRRKPHTTPIELRQLAEQRLESAQSLHPVD